MNIHDGWVMISSGIISKMLGIFTISLGFLWTNQYEGRMFWVFERGSVADWVCLKNWVDVKVVVELNGKWWLPSGLFLFFGGVTATLTLRFRAVFFPLCLHAPKGHVASWPVDQSPNRLVSEQRPGKVSDEHSGWTMDGHPQFRLDASFSSSKSPSPIVFHLNLRYSNLQEDQRVIEWYRWCFSHMFFQFVHPFWGYQNPSFGPWDARCFTEFVPRMQDPPDPPVEEAAVMGYS